MKSYVKFVLVESVKAPFEAFQSGFRKVFANSDVLALFHYKELMAVVRGKQVVDFGNLEKVCLMLCCGGLGCVHVHVYTC